MKVLALFSSYIAQRYEIKNRAGQPLSCGTLLRILWSCRRRETVVLNCDISFVSWTFISRVAASLSTKNIKISFNWLGRGVNFHMYWGSQYLFHWIIYIFLFVGYIRSFPVSSRSLSVSRNAISAPMSDWSKILQSPSFKNSHPFRSKFWPYFRTVGVASPVLLPLPWKRMLVHSDAYHAAYRTQLVS
jgi:hypothetical protein